MDRVEIYINELVEKTGNRDYCIRIDCRLKQMNLLFNVWFLRYFFKLSPPLLPIVVFFKCSPITLLAD